MKRTFWIMAIALFVYIPCIALVDAEDEEISITEMTVKTTLTPRIWTIIINPPEQLQTYISLVLKGEVVSVQVGGHVLCDVTEREFGWAKRRAMRGWIYSGGQGGEARVWTIVLRDTTWTGGYEVALACVIHGDHIAIFHDGELKAQVFPRQFKRFQIMALTGWIFSGGPVKEGGTIE